MTIINLLTNTLSWIWGHTRPSDVALAMLGLFMFSCVRDRLTNNGPMLWPMFGINPTLLVNFSRAYDWATEAFTVTGGTFPYRGIWFGGARGFITVDPVKIEYMLRTNSKNFPKGEYYRERFFDLLGDGIFNADGVSWQRQRRLANTEMHSGRFARFSLRTIQELVRNKLLLLVEKLAVNGDSVDLQEILLRFTFDNICSTALGFDPGCLAADLPDVPFAKAFEESTESTLYRIIVPSFVWKTMKRFGLGSERRLKKAAEFVHTFSDKIVKDRRRELLESGGFIDRCDLLSRLMELDISGDDEFGEQERLSDKFLSDFCISFILAGRDTSSVALSWFFWLLNKNPSVEAKVVAEIRTVLSSRDGTVGDGDVFSGEELKRMVYLQAAISESLRLYPPVPIDLKEVLEDDVFPDGTEVKRGYMVLYCMYGMARMGSIWGRHCREFRPERWLDETGKLVSESQFKFAVFNGGPRLCIGKSFAYMQMKMVAASILQRYEVRVLEGQRIVPKVTTTLYMKNGLMVSFKPRKLL